MNENSKTIVFVAVACAAALVTFLAVPRSAPIEEQDLRGKQLFPEFTDALTATGIEIVKFDEDTGEIHPFKVEQVDGLWSIPSHDNYPADAKDQLADVAADMVDLLVLEQASDSRGDQALYGVVEPDPKTLRSGDTGVGTKVTMWGRDGKELMALVIGKAVPDQDSLHYVRKPGRDQIYVVEVDTSKLTTRFQAWIEEDLLKLSPFDIQRVDVFDYSVDELNGSVIQRGRFVVDHDDTGDPRWKLAEDYRFDGQKWVPEAVPEDLELNTEKLNTMKTALDDLEIVDVAKKPAGLSADLRAEESFMENREAQASLQSRGFYVARLGEELGLFSNEGEMRVRMKDGVEYVLRFGEIAAGTGGVDDKKKDAADDADDAEQSEKDPESGLNRYLFVMAEFNEDAIAKPELEPLPLDKPGIPRETEPEAAPPNESAPAPADETNGETEPNGEAKETEGETIVEKPVEEKAQVETPTEPAPVEVQPAEEEPAEEAAPAEGADGAEAITPAEQPTEEAESPPEETKPAEEAAPAEEQPAEEAEPPMSEEDLKAERERIERENKRKEDEYQEKVKKGKERVEELNDRFADWYYIISDEVYQKIRITRANLFKAKEKPEGEDDVPAEDDFSPGALDRLQEGLPER